MAIRKKLHKPVDSLDSMHGAMDCTDLFEIAPSRKATLPLPLPLGTPLGSLRPLLEPRPLLFCSPESRATDGVGRSGTGGVVAMTGRTIRATAVVFAWSGSRPLVTPDCYQQRGSRRLRSRAAGPSREDDAPSGVRSKEGSTRAESAFSLARRRGAKEGLLTRLPGQGRRSSFGVIEMLGISWQLAWRRSTRAAVITEARYCSWSVHLDLRCDKI